VVRLIATAIPGYFMLLHFTAIAMATGAAAIISTTVTELAFFPTVSPVQVSKIEPLER